MRIRDLTGLTFERLTVLRRGKTRNGKVYWICKCTCGKTTSAQSAKIVSGHTRSCGCMRAEATKRMGLAQRTHGEGAGQTPEYRIWRGMLERCRNTKSKNFNNYGGRGITVCKRWISYENFLSDVGRRPSPTHSLDRVKNNRGYGPTNFRWATPREQGRNTRKNRRLHVNGETLTLVEWSERLGVSKEVIWGRLDLGWSPRDAVTTPLRKAKTLTVGGVTKTLSEWGKPLGLSERAMHARLGQGWSPERVTTTPRTKHYPPIWVPNAARKRRAAERVQES